MIFIYIYVYIYIYNGHKSDIMKMYKDEKKKDLQKMILLFEEIFTNVKLKHLTLANMSTNKITH